MAHSSTTKPSNLRIFISHSSKDSPFTMKLVQHLRSILGDDNTVWHDVSGSLHAGDEWWRIIVNEITTRQVFIVVLSPDAMASPWVNDEINLAWKQKNSKAGKLILPIMYRKCDVREDLDTLNIISFLPPKSYEAAF